MINCRFAERYTPSITYDMYRTLSESGIKTTYKAVKQV